MANFIEKTKRKNFQWDHHMVENLIKCTVSYKARMLKTLTLMPIKLVYIEKFAWLRQNYNKDEELYFGPVAVDIINEKESKEVVKRGTK